MFVPPSLVDAYYLHVPFFAQWFTMQWHVFYLGRIKYWAAQTEKILKLFLACLCEGHRDPRDQQVEPDSEEESSHRAEVHQQAISNQRIQVWP